MRRIIGQFLLLPWLALARAPGIAAADEPAILSVTAGAFDVTQDGAEHTEMGFEVRLAPTTLGFLPRSFPIRPTVGAAGTGQNSFWTYVGFRFDQKVTRWVITPGFAVSLYERGGGLDLGGALEFRSSIEAACRIGSRLRMGVALYHLSNASLYDQNPGSESLVVTLSTPLTPR